MTSEKKSEDNIGIHTGVLIKSTISQNDTIGGLHNNFTQQKDLWHCCTWLLDPKAYMDITIAIFMAHHGDQSFNGKPQPCQYLRCQVWKQTDNNIYLLFGSG